MKKLIAIILALTAVLSAGGCGKNEPAGTNAPAFTLPDMPTFTFPQDTDPAEDTQPPSADSILPSEDAKSRITAQVEGVLEALSGEFEALAEKVDGYPSYVEKAEEIGAFYEKISAVSAELCMAMRLLSLDLAQSILASGKSTDDMYDDAELIYDLIYDDMGDEIYDGIYDGILDEMYDAFYDGALDDQPDDVKYADWSAARSQEYEQWSDTRSDTYEHWSDFRGDVYEFWSDLRGELWDDNTEDALEELEDFRKDVEKLSGKLDAAETIPGDTVSETGIRPEFQEAMDSYEAFFDEYVVFMTAYLASDDVLSMASEYTAVMQQYMQAMAALQEIGQSSLSEEEALYYAEVMLRINQKLLEVA